MFQMISGGELMIIAAIVTFLFGGSKAFQSVKNIRRDVTDLKENVTGIKDDIKSEIKPDIFKIREID